MRKLMLFLLIALVLVGATLAGYGLTDSNRRLVLSALSDRDITEQSFSEERSDAGGHWNTSSAGRSVLFSEYYELTNELLIADYRSDVEFNVFG